ncbi:MAG: hypothetical protein MJ146_02215 [Clostridia bacterium]|nr:hypothetical protein [Clostridia bacterium]
MKARTKKLITILTISILLFTSCAFSAYTYDSAYSSVSKPWFPKYVQDRNQHPFGTCWAFSTTNTADICYYKEYYEKHDKKPVKKVTSPGRFAYFYYNRSSDPLGLTLGDFNRVTSKNKGWTHAGCNTINAMVAMAGRTGLAEENGIYQQLLDATDLDPGFVASYDRSYENGAIRTVDKATYIKPSHFKDKASIEKRQTFSRNCKHGLWLDGYPSKSYRVKVETK